MKPIPFNPARHPAYRRVDEAWRVFSRNGYDGRRPADILFVALTWRRVHREAREALTNSRKSQ